MRIRFRLPFKRGSQFKPTTGRRRLVIVGLAVAMTLTIGGAMLSRHAQFVGASQLRENAEPPRCAPGQTTGCVGGTMGVIVVPPASSPGR